VRKWLLLRFSMYLFLLRVYRMKVNVDFSIFISSSTAYGNIHGQLMLPAIPSSGDELSFLHSFKKKEFPKITGGTWSIEIDKVIFFVGKDEVFLSLQDIVVSTKKDADALIDYFVDGFGLYFDCYDYE